MNINGQLEQVLPEIFSQLSSVRFKCCCCSSCGFTPPVYAITSPPPSRWPLHGFGPYRTPLYADSGDHVVSHQPGSQLHPTTPYTCIWLAHRSNVRPSKAPLVRTLTKSASLREKARQIRPYMKTTTTVNCYVSRVLLVWVPMVNTQVYQCVVLILLPAFFHYNYIVCIIFVMLWLDKSVLI